MDYSRCTPTNLDKNNYLKNIHILTPDVNGQKKNSMYNYNQKVESWQQMRIIMIRFEKFFYIYIKDH